MKVFGKALKSGTVAFGTGAVTNNTDGSYLWTCPVGVFIAQIKLWGGGGRGSWNHNSYADCYGGGAGYVEGLFRVIPGQQYRIIVGSGGKGPGSPQFSTGDFGRATDVQDVLGNTAGGLSGFFNTSSASPTKSDAWLVAAAGGSALGNKNYGAPPNPKQSGPGGGSTGVTGTGGWGNPDKGQPGTQSAHGDGTTTDLFMRGDADRPGNGWFNGTDSDGGTGDGIGGGSGSSYLNTASPNHISSSTVTGSGRNAGNAGDSDFASGTGLGGDASNSVSVNGNGGNGRCVINWGSYIN